MNHPLKAKYIRLVLIAQVANLSVDESVTAITENIAYRMEREDVSIVCAEGREIPAEIGQQYFSVWR